MSREKQIEEMTAIINKAKHEMWEGNCKFENHSETIAKYLYDAGYRKPSEVIEEYRKKVYSKMEKYTVFGREYIQRIMREVEKEMKGGAEKKQTAERHFAPEDVRKMSQKEVKENYTAIMQSMKKWK